MHTFPCGIVIFKWIELNLMHLSPVVFSLLHNIPDTTYTLNTNNKKKIEQMEMSFTFLFFFVLTDLSYTAPQRRKLRSHITQTHSHMHMYIFHRHKCIHVLKRNDKERKECDFAFKISLASTFFVLYQIVFHTLHVTIACFISV